MRRYEMIGEKPRHECRIWLVIIITKGSRNV